MSFIKGIYKPIPLEELIGRRAMVSLQSPYCAGWTGTIKEINAVDGSVIIKGDKNFSNRFSVNIKYLILI